MDKKLILKIMDQNPRSFGWIARKLNIKQEDNRKFSGFLNNLVKQGELFTTRERQFYKPKVLETIEGVIRMTSKGFGFVDREDGESVFIGPGATNKAFDRDTVKINIFQDPTKADAYSGFVTEIVERYRTTLVGTIIKFGENFGFKPLDDRVNVMFRFVNTEGLKPDYIVKAKIVEYQEHFTMLDSILIIGHKDDAKVDIQSAIENANIPYT